MRRPRPRLRPLAAALLIAAAPAAALAGWWDDAGGARPATLEELRKDPDAWRDVPVVLDVRFARTEPAGNPYFTQFTPANWQPIAVTFGPAPPSPTRVLRVGQSPAAARQTFSRLFVRRGGPAELRVAELAAGERVLVHATVRDHVRGEPWLEVTRVTGPGDQPTPEEQAALDRADRFLAAQNPAAAEAFYRKLLEGRELPPAVAYSVRRGLADALLGQRRTQDARDLYRALLDAVPDAAAAAEIRDRIAKADAAPPASPLAARAASRPPELPAPLVIPPVPDVGLRLAPPAGALQAPPAAETERAEPVRRAADPTAEPAAPAAPPARPAAEELPPPAPRPGLSGPR